MIWRRRTPRFSDLVDRLEAGERLWATELSNREKVLQHLTKTGLDSAFADPIRAQRPSELRLTPLWTEVVGAGDEPRHIAERKHDRQPPARTVDPHDQ